ncbi:succinate dehydrogenase/fumarate reductase iron-sulfur subunit [Picrophilus oshimae]
MKMVEEKEITVKIRKYSKANGESWQSYKVKVDRYTQMTEVLRRIKTEQDPSLSYRAACHMAVCGSCSMIINGEPRLACKTLALDIADEKNEVTLQPMGYFETERDLIPDIDEFYDRMHRVKPRLYADDEVLKGDFEPRMTPEDQKEVWKFAQCIWCGLCVSACPSVRIDENFLGPAAHAKGYRFLADSRDTIRDERINILMDSAWRCTSCYMCYEVCPRDIEPVIAIKKTKAYVNDFKKDTPVTVMAKKHDDAVSESIAETGKIKESSLYLKTFGITEAMRDMRYMFEEGKLKYAFSKDNNVKRIDEIKKIMEE